jgi:hypothetical protein
LEQASGHPSILVDATQWLQHGRLASFAPVILTPDFDDHASQPARFIAEELSSSAVALEFTAALGAAAETFSLFGSDEDAIIVNFRCTESSETGNSCVVEAAFSG